MHVGISKPCALCGSVALNQTSKRWLAFVMSDPPPAPACGACVWCCYFLPLSLDVLVRRRRRRRRRHQPRSVLSAVCLLEGAFNFPLYIAPGSQNTHHCRRRHRIRTGALPWLVQHGGRTLRAVSLICGMHATSGVPVPKCVSNAHLTYMHRRYGG